MKGHRSWSLCISLLLVIGLVSFAPAQQPKPGGTLRVAWEADISGLDPHLSFGMQARLLVGNLFNSLVTIDSELNFVPDLAESWEILENSKVYVFHLRKGVTFHDGTAFDAEAVRWNYQRVVDPEEKALDAAYYNIVDAVEVLDAHTVRFTFKQPTRTVLPVMAADRVGFLQMSPASYKRWGREDVRLHPVGTGPFMLAKWEQNQVIVLEKNPHYFKPGLPYLDRLELRIMKDGITRVTALRAGEVDFANMVPREHIERLSRDPQVYVLRGKDTQRIATFFNLRKEAFQDVRVRRAVLGYGIDRPAIVKTALLGQAQPLWSFVPPGSRGQIDFGEQFPYDPDKARALLKEAGSDEQNPLRYTIMTHGAEASLPIIATIMKTQLAKIGVEVTVEVLDRPIFLRRVTRDRDWDQFLANVAAAIDPHTISQGIDSRAGNNAINHADPQVDALIDRMREAATEEAYLQAGYDFQRYVVENMMSTSVSSYGHLQAARTYVKGYENLHGYKLRFETTWLDR
jgi:peptide/nickel transport system substrate-binding protein